MTSQNYLWAREDLLQLYRSVHPRERSVRPRLEGVEWGLVDARIRDAIEALATYATAPRVPRPPSSRPRLDLVVLLTNGPADQLGSATYVFFEPLVDVVVALDHAGRKASISADSGLWHSHEAALRELTDGVEQLLQQGQLARALGAAADGIRRVFPVQCRQPRADRPTTLVLFEAESGQYLVLREHGFFLGGVKSDATGYYALRRWDSHDVQVWWDHHNRKWWFKGADFEREVRDGDELQLGESSTLLAQVHPQYRYEPPETPHAAAASLAAALEAGDFACDTALNKWVEAIAGADCHDIRKALCARAEAVARGPAALPFRIFAVHLIGAVARVDAEAVGLLERLLGAADLRAAVARALILSPMPGATGVLEQFARAGDPTPLDDHDDLAGHLACVALFYRRADRR